MKVNKKLQVIATINRKLIHKSKRDLVNFIVQFITFLIGVVILFNFNPTQVTINDEVSWGWSLAATFLWGAVIWLSMSLLISLFKRFRA